MSNTEEIMGTAFPFAIDPETGGVAQSQGREKIRQNLRVLLSTRIGERPMERNFGTRIPSLVHDINDAALAQIVITQAQEAVLQWEPRILINDAQINHQEGELNLALSYGYLGEQTNDELSFPLI